MIKPEGSVSASSDHRAEGERWHFAQQSEREFWLNLDEQTFRACEEGYRSLATDLARHTRTHLGLRENIRVLQIGCAVEDAVMYFPYGQRFAIDPLADFYIRHFERSRNPRVTYFTAIGEAIPFAANVFDLMICSNVLDHMLQPEELLREVRRTLKSDGIFYLSVDVYSTDTYLQRKEREARGEVFDPCHPHTFTVETFREMVAAARFHVLAAGEAPSGKGDESVRYCMTLVNEKKIDEEAAK